MFRYSESKKISCQQYLHIFFQFFFFQEDFLFQCCKDGDLDGALALLDDSNAAAAAAVVDFQDEKVNPFQDYLNKLLAKLTDYFADN